MNFKLSISISVFLFLLLKCFSIPIETNKKNLTETLNDSGLFYMDKGEYIKSLTFFNEALSISKNSSDLLLTSTLLNNIGIVYYYKGDYQICLNHYLESLEICKEIGDDEKIGKSLLNTGIVYKKIGNYDKSIELLLDAVLVFEGLQIPKEQASCFNTIANIQTKQKDYVESLKYHFKSLKLYKEINYQKGIASSLNNIGTTYKYLDSLNLALEYYQKSLLIKVKLDNQDLLSTSYLNIGKLYIDLNQIKKAREHIQQSILINIEIGDKNGICLGYIALGELNLKLKKYDNAKDILFKGLLVSNQVESAQTRLDIYEFLRKLYVEIGDFSKAIEYYDNYNDLKDSIFNIEKTSALNELKERYETEKREQEISSLKSIESIQKKSLKAKTKFIVLLSSGLFIISILVIISIHAYYAKKRAHIKIQTLSQEKSHRIKNNLQTAATLLSKQSKYIKDEYAKEAILESKLRIQAISLIDRFLQENNDSLMLNLDEYIRLLIHAIFNNYKSSGMESLLSFELEKIKIDAEKVLPIGLIVNEIVTNALKYAFPDNPSPSLVIKLHIINKKIYLKMSDNGKGFPLDIEAKETESLGMELIHKMVKQLKGDIDIINKQGVHFAIAFKK